MNDAEVISAVIVGLVVAFYFMIIRPDQKFRAQRKQQMRDLRPGDEVLTTSGFIARVKDIRVSQRGSTQILLELADGVVFTAVPTAVLERLTPAAEPDNPSPDPRPQGTGVSS